VADNASSQVLDFTDVKDGGSFNKKRVPMGDYEARITKVVDAPTKKKDDGSGGEPQWLYTIELTKAYTDRKFPFYCKLTANQLWKLRNLFIAAGKPIPKKKVKLNPNLVVGKLIGVTLEDDEFDGKLQSNIVQTFPASDLVGNDDDEDDDAEDLTDEEELDDEEEEEEPEPAPVRRKKAAPAPEPEDEDEEEEEVDDEEDEDEEEEPAPAPRKKAAAKIPAQRKSSPATKRAAAKKVEVDDEELEELDLDGV
jgi:hypothetical protein